MSGTREKENMNLTLEKRTLVDHLTHFRQEFLFSQQLRGMLIRHSNMFYVSLKGDRDSVFLRSAYRDSQLCSLRRRWGPSLLFHGSQGGFHRKMMCSAKMTRQRWSEMDKLITKIGPILIISCLMAIKTIIMMVKMIGAMKRMMYLRILITLIVQVWKEESSQSTMSPQIMVAKLLAPVFPDGRLREWW